MAIQAVCGSCFMEYSVKDSLAGKKIKCKECGEVFRIPEANNGGEQFDELFADESPPQRQAARSSPATPAKRRPAARKGLSSGLIVGLVGAGVVGIVGLMVVAALVLPFLTGARRGPVGGNPGVPGGVGVPVQAAGAPAGDPGALFPVASVPLPAFPELGTPRMAPGSPVKIYDLSFASANPGANGPGTQMNLRVYVPDDQAPPKSVGCVLVAPAGTNLLTGNDLDDPNYHDETLPYAQAGYVTIMFSLDGGVRDYAQMSDAQFAIAYRNFGAAQAGLVNARNALEFALAKLPQVDPARIFSAGHSSAAVLALLFGEHEPRLKACLAYAPASDVEQRLADVTRDPRAERLLPGVGSFARRSSPRTHMAEMKCPVFMFHAVNDSNEPIGTSTRFANDLQKLGKKAWLEMGPRGDHYDSMIQEGIPKGIAWMKALPGER